MLCSGLHNGIESFELLHGLWEGGQISQKP